MILVIRLTCVIASDIIVLRTQLSTFALQFRWLLTILLVATAVGDLVVAGALAYFLAASRSGFLKCVLMSGKLHLSFEIRTDRIIKRLILFSIGGCSLCVTRRLVG